MAILTFHHVDKRFILGLNNYSPARFRNLLQFLQAAGCGFVSLEEYLELSDSSKSIALTFDDGFEDFYIYAFQVLQELSIPAIIFIPAGFIGHPASWDYAGKCMHLNSAQIREISHAGIKVASHGFSHTDLTTISGRLLKMELDRSKKSLEDLTGKEVSFISYPFARFSGEVEGYAIKAGYRKGFSLSGSSRSPYSFTISRSAVYATDTRFSVTRKLAGGLLNRLETVKGAVINSYAAGTVLLNRFKSPPFLSEG